MTPTVQLPSNGGIQSVTAQVTGLSPNTTYHYQLVASTTAAPAIDGGDASFTTFPTPPACTALNTSTSYSTPVLVTLSCTGTGLSYSIDSPPAHGSLSTISGNTLTYTPSAAYVGGGDSFVVTATDSASQTANETVNITVASAPLPANTVSPAISGAARVGATLSCSSGTWTGQPGGYSYVWDRNGTPISGATSATYLVQALDEGSSLTCTVDGVNATGFGMLAATSPGVRIAVPFVANCPAATGSVAGQTLGLAKLGETRRQARRAFKHSSVRGQKYEDFFCLTPVGLRVGYASPKALTALPRSKRAALLGRVIWISTSSPHYAINGVGSGATLASAKQLLQLGNVIQIGANDWFLAPVGSVTAVLKVRAGIVQEIGIGNHRLTRGRAAQNRFLTSFS